MADSMEVVEEKVDMFKFLVEGVLMVSIGLVGALGNFLCIHVFSKASAQKSFHHLMVTLAIFDLLYITMAFLLFSLPELYIGLVVIVKRIVLNI